MNIEMIKVDTAEAYRQYQVYKEQSRRGGSPTYLQDLRRAYYHLKSGKRVVDAIAAIQKGGLDVSGNPKFAIVNANAKTVIFEKSNGNEYSGLFMGSMRRFERWNTGTKVLELPVGSFPRWKVEPQQYGDIANKRIGAPVPIVPGSVLARSRSVNLRNLFILWEVEEWKPAPPKDPILLSRLTKNLFVVIGEWDLTPLEQAIIRGRL